MAIGCNVNLPSRRGYVTDDVLRSRWICSHVLKETSLILSLTKSDLLLYKEVETQWKLKLISTIYCRDVIPSAHIESFEMTVTTAVSLGIRYIILLGFLLLIQIKNLQDSLLSCNTLYFGGRVKQRRNKHATCTFWLYTVLRPRRQDPSESPQS
jgi:hypothetical protein